MSPAKRRPSRRRRKPRAWSPATCTSTVSSWAPAQKVKAGDTIAVVGRSGVRRSPPHLHFEVRVDDRFHDPWRYFADSIMPPNVTVTHRYNVLKQKSRLRAIAKAQRARAKAKVLTTR